MWVIDIGVRSWHQPAGPGQAGGGWGWSFQESEMLVAKCLFATCCSLLAHRLQLSLPSVPPESVPYRAASEGLKVEAWFEQVRSLMGWNQSLVAWKEKPDLYLVTESCSLALFFVQTNVRYPQATWWVHTLPIRLITARKCLCVSTVFVSLLSLPEEGDRSSGLQVQAKCQKKKIILGTKFCCLWFVWTSWTVGGQKNRFLKNIYVLKMNILHPTITKLSVFLCFLHSRKHK